MRLCVWNLLSAFVNTNKKALLPYMWTIILYYVIFFLGFLFHHVLRCGYQWTEYGIFGVHILHWLYHSFLDLVGYVIGLDRNGLANIYSRLFFSIGKVQNPVDFDPHVPLTHSCWREYHLFWTIIWSTFIFAFYNARALSPLVPCNNFSILCHRSTLVVFK